MGAILSLSHPGEVQPFTSPGPLPLSTSCNSFFFCTCPKASKFSLLGLRIAIFGYFLQNNWLQLLEYDGFTQPALGGLKPRDTDKKLTKYDLKCYENFLKADFGDKSVLIQNFFKSFSVWFFSKTLGGKGAGWKKVANWTPGPPSHHQARPWGGWDTPPKPGCLPEIFLLLFTETRNPLTREPLRGGLSPDPPTSLQPRGVFQFKEA